MDNTGSSFKDNLTKALTWFTTVAGSILAIIAVIDIVMLVFTGDFLFSPSPFGGSDMFEPFRIMFLIWGIPISIALTPGILGVMIGGVEDEVAVIAILILGIPILGVIVAILAVIGCFALLIPAAIAGLIVQATLGAFRMDPIFGIFVFFLLSGMALSALGFGDQGGKIVAIIFFKDD